MGRLIDADKFKGKVIASHTGSGISDECMENFDQCYDDTVGEDTELMLDNIYSNRSFEVKTPVVTVKVNPDRTDLVATKVIDGRQCLVIELQGDAEVNGVAVKLMSLFDFEKCTDTSDENGFSDFWEEN